MSTYVQRDDDGNARPTSIGKPTPAHALTKAAESARQMMRDLPPIRVADGKVTRSLLTRAEVEAAYVHPEPEVAAREVGFNTNSLVRHPLRASGARSLWKLAEANGHRVKATYNRGTTAPRWTANSPDNKKNPGPPVDASQYHGEIVDCETVYVMTKIGTAPVGRIVTPSRRIRGVWLNGKLDRIEADGVETTLKAAREVLS